MTKDQQAYLRELVEADVRRQREAISKLRLRHGQDYSDFEQVFYRYAFNLRFAEEAYRMLGGDPDKITDKAGRYQ